MLSCDDNLYQHPRFSAEPLAFYDFRRTGANLINTPGVASPSEANLAMGHGVDATTSSVCLVFLFLDCCTSRLT